MDLERQHIVIRERSIVGLADLTLRVARVHAGQLLTSLIIGATPLAIMNYFLLRGMLFVEPSAWWQDINDSFGFLFWSAVLVAIEAPIATCWMTLYLGHWMFSGDPRRRDMFESFVESLPQLFLLGFLLRPFFVLHAYLPEIILLERTPFSAKTKTAITTLRRNRALHFREKGEILVHRLLAVVVGAAFFVCWYPILAYSYRMIMGVVETPPLFFPIVSSAILWLLAGFFAIFRFLGYMNTRIRHEGWDVELAFRVERARMTGPKL